MVATHPLFNQRIADEIILADLHKNVPRGNPGFNVRGIPGGECKDKDRKL